VKLVKQFGPKHARAFSGGGGLYAWLYKNDREWLIATNYKFKATQSPRRARVDWKARDKGIVVSLRAILKASKDDLDCPRQTKNWLLLQVSKGRSHLKNLNKLPLTSDFIKRFSESISEYQIRRLLRSISKLMDAGEEIRLWRILRMAGLNKQRIRPPTRLVINELGLT
jgi:hypothetical protein